MVRNVNQSISHSMDDRGLDAYFTPWQVLDAIKQYEDLKLPTFEPSCGSGNLSEYLRSIGTDVYSSDITNYGYKFQNETKDFFEYDNMPYGYEQIITNPPFYCWSKYAQHAKKLCNKVILLGKLTILESQERTEVLEDGTFCKTLLS